MCSMAVFFATDAQRALSFIMNNPFSFLCVLRDSVANILLK